MAKTGAIEKDNKPVPGVGWATEKWTEMREFYAETRNELKRVTWPSRKQVQSTTIVVVVTVFFFGFFFMVSDAVVAWLINLVFKKGV